MPYSNDPQNVPSDYVRFLLGDTNPTKEEMTDNEVEFLLAEEGNNPTRAAARGAEILAAKYSSEADERRVGPLLIRRTGSSRAQRYSDLARQLWRRLTTVVAPYAGGLSRAEKSSAYADTDLVRPAFRRHMMRYPVGSTDDGGEQELLSGPDDVWP